MLDFHCRLLSVLQWSQQMQKQEGQYPKQSSADRKECLYHDIIDYFDKGKVRKLFVFMIHVRDSLYMYVLRSL